MRTSRSSSTQSDTNRRSNDSTVSLLSRASGGHSDLHELELDASRGSEAVGPDIWQTAASMNAAARGPPGPSTQHRQQPHERLSGAHDSLQSAGLMPVRTVVVEGPSQRPDTTSSGIDALGDLDAELWGIEDDLFIGPPGSALPESQGQSVASGDSRSASDRRPTGVDADILQAPQPQQLMSGWQQPGHNYVAGMLRSHAPSRMLRP